MFLIKMASHFKWYPSDEEVVVPWNARYSFPSQANKAVKLTPRIPPKSGTTFTPGQVMRLEFPAQGYVNPQNTTLEFDVTLTDFSGGTQYAQTRFQNNIQSIFSRVRLLYGATPLEDIINYNVIVRALTEWTATNQNNTIDQCSIAEGIGGVVVGTDGSATKNFGLVNVRQAYIQGIDNSGGTGAATNFGQAGTKFGTVYATRRYQVNFALGLFTQSKLIPTKFMASQLAIELTLESAAGALVCIIGSSVGTTPPTYSVTNVNLIPEILEFDASYDAMFLKGLREGGVPIKFSSWHTYIFSTGGSATMNLQIQERSRSVKSLFAVQRKGTQSIYSDSGALLFSSVGSMQNYQYRIGGRYFPAAPVQCTTVVGGAISNGGAEAYIELQKALNQVGDYRLSTSCNTLRWALAPFSASVGSTSNATTVSDLDYAIDITTFNASTAVPTAVLCTDVENGTIANSSPFSGSVGSACFAAAIDLETSNGVEISGLNAEEQSDISLLMQFSSAQTSTNVMEVYTYYDAMIILRENNVLELIQ